MRSLIIGLTIIVVASIGLAVISVVEKINSTKPKTKTEKTK